MSPAIFFWRSYNWPELIVVYVERKVLESVPVIIPLFDSPSSRLDAPSSHAAERGADEGSADRNQSLEPLFHKNICGRDFAATVKNTPRKGLRRVDSECYSVYGAY